MSYETTIIDINENTTQDEVGKNFAKKAVWKKATVGAGVGILLGMTPAVASAVWNSIDPSLNYEDSENGDSKTNVPDTPIDENPQIAEGGISTAPEIEEEIIDNMEDIEEVTFSQAFNEARALYGPGHSFEWKGQTYSTYTEAEWDNMSDEQRTQHCEDIVSELNAQTTAQEATSNPNDLYSEITNDILESVDDTGDDELLAEVAAEEASTEATFTQSTDNASIPTDDIELDIVDTQDEGNVSILDVEYDNATGATLAEAMLNGEDVVLVDIDGDNMADYIVHDPENTDAHYMENWEELNNEVNIAPTTDEDFLMNDGSVDYASDF